MTNYQHELHHSLKRLEKNPDDNQLRLSVALLYQLMGQNKQAIFHYQKSLQGAVNEPHDIHCTLGYLWKKMLCYEEAILAFEQALRLKPVFPTAQFALAQTYLNMNAADKALLIYDSFMQYSVSELLLKMKQAYEDNEQSPVLPDQAPNWLLQLIALAGKALLYASKGEYNVGYQLLSPLLNSPYKNIQVGLSFTAIARFLEQTNDVISYGEELLKQPHLLSLDRRSLLFNLGQLYDRNQQYSQAFHYFSQANQSQATSSIQEFVQLKESIKSIFTSTALKKMFRADRHSGQPVFIIGMPRSGTSLIEQILSSHPSVYGAGELPEIEKIFHSIPLSSMISLTQNQLNQLAERYLFPLKNHPKNALYTTDKYPFNFIYLGFIELLFPEAKVIHVQRHPLDTCLSCYMQNFTKLSFTTDLNQLANYYWHYQDLMLHWEQVLSLSKVSIQYEKLVTQPEKMIKQLVHFLELPWDKNCLKFFEQERMVNTASASQVKQPIYTTSIGRYKGYREHLQPLIEVLGEAKYDNMTL